MKEKAKLEYLKSLRDIIDYTESVVALRKILHYVLIGGTISLYLDDSNEGLLFYKLLKEELINFDTLKAEVSNGVISFELCSVEI